MAYPTTIDTFGTTSGTQTLVSANHSDLHNNMARSIEGVETTLGTTAGTSVLKNFVAGNFAARTNGETFGTPTLNTATIGTPTIANPTINVGSDASGDLYYRNSGGSISRIAIGTPTQQLVVSAGTAPSWSTSTTLTSKFGTLSRDLAGTTGAVSYTGVGFTPTSIHFQASVDNTDFRSFGMSDSNRGGACFYYTSATTNALANQVAMTNAVIFISPGAGTWQGGTIQSYDADGFTISWTKTSTPTGTMRINYLAYR